MPRNTGRTQACDRSDARARLGQAESLLAAAELALADDAEVTNPGVAASLAVLAGIAASDAACCAKLGRRARGQHHQQAVDLVATVRPHGQQLARDLRRLLNRKDDVHYGMTLIAAGDATDMVGWATRMISDARRVVEA